MQRDLIGNALMLGFFYLHYFIIIPALYFKQKRLPYLLSILVGFMVICLLPSLLTGRNPFLQGAAAFPPEDVYLPPPPPGPFLAEIKHQVFLFIAVVFFSLLLRIRSRRYKEQTTRHAAELATIRAQINPHFLFNTLNSIYALAVRKDDATADSIVHLSGLMRYVFKESGDDNIPLHKELEYLENYVELQRSRLGDTVVIRYTVEQEAVAPVGIVPLILISFIENAFKYGVNPEAASAISIHIKVSKKTLYLSVHNYKVVLPQHSFSSGIGVHNAKERLELLYPGKHQLEITEDAHHYLVTLIMELL
jgi:LytS/YehU family sensor histidine kinase